ncbi:DUF3959 family protein [Bacillus cereus]
MLLSGLFPIAGLTKQIPLEQSIYIGGLLFFTSFGSYFAKKDVFTYMQLDSVCAIYNITVSYLASRYFNKLNHSKCENCCMCRVNSMFIPFSYIWTYFGLILIMGRFTMGYKRSTVVIHT